MKADMASFIEYYIFDRSLMISHFLLKIFLEKVAKEGESPVGKKNI